MDFYDQIFKRKSFHIFKDIEKLSSDDIAELEGFIKETVPLYPEIRTEIHIVEEKETSCHRGGEYCILFYSEKKDGYLRNIGYIGEQVDLWLAARNIGSLWFGIGRPKEKKFEGLDYVIMIAIAKMPEEKFRKDMFKAKRKELDMIWKGEDPGIANIVRFTPSACNTQPWYVENDGDRLQIYRYREAGKRGIMPLKLVTYYNRIDIGIFLYMLETCLIHEGYAFERELFTDSGGDEKLTLSAIYTYKK